MELIFDGPPLLGQSVPKVGQEMERGVYMGIFDKLKDSKNDKTFEDKLSYLKKYHRDVELISSKVENIIEIPESWKKIFCINKKEERIAVTIKCWKALFANELRNTILYLEENLLDVNLIKYQGKYSILYSILSSNKKVLYYEGGNCNTTHFPSKLQSKLDNLPSSIVKFYQELHNGFFYYASGGMGLLESNDIVVFDDEEWGILDDLKHPLKIYLPTTFGIFGSGMGGYVAVDLSDCDSCKATLWFSNRQPEYDINFWDIVDEWIVLGMQG